MDVFQIFVAAGAAVALFLYGIDHLSAEIQRAAGERMRGLLSNLTSNRWVGALLGAITTALVQSSSATTVITVGLVNAGVISFSQSLGIIAGANIGTTITAQLVAFDLTETAPLFIIAGFVMSISQWKYRFLGKSVFYFGLLFMSFNLISQALDPLKSDAAFISFIAELENPILGLLFGIVITLLFQSSAVTTGITVLLGAQGIITLVQAIPVILGANIGTTSTAIMAAYRLDAFSKRAAVAHTIFNFLGVLIFLPIIGIFAAFVQSLGGGTAVMIANAHLLFNIATALVFLAFSNHIADFVSSKVKTDKKELIFRTQFISPQPPAETSNAIEEVRKEMIHDLEMIRELFIVSIGMAKAGNVSEMHYAMKLKSLSDFLGEKAAERLAVISRRKLSNEEAVTLSKLARISSEIRQLSELGKDMYKVARRMDARGMKMMPQSVSELSTIDILLFDNLSMLAESGGEIAFSSLKSAERNLHTASRRTAKSYLAHIQRLKKRTSEGFTGTEFTLLLAMVETANSKVVWIMRQLANARKHVP